jgi:ABC-type sugar transport system substrate-binding protein
MIYKRVSEATSAGTRNMRCWGRHLLTCGLLSLALVNSASADPHGKRIAVLVGTTQNPFIASLAKAFQEEATAAGMQVILLSNPNDPAIEAQQMNDVIGQKVDLIALQAISDRAIIPAMTRAKAAHIPVVLVNSPIEDGRGDLYLSFVGEDNVALGRVTGEALVAATKGMSEVKTALITGVLDEGVARRRVPGFKEAVAKDPAIKIVATEDAKWSTTTSEQMAGQLFARFAAQGGLQAIYAMADNMAHGVIQAAKAANVPLGVGPGKLTVVSSNCMKFGVDHITAGEQYSTATQMPTRTAKAAVGVIVDYFNGKPVKHDHFLQVEAITKANLAQYAEACTF